MTLAEDNIAHYDARFADYASFAHDIESALAQILRDAAIEYFSIQSRVKSRESVWAKLSVAGARLPADIVGVRVLCYFQEDIPVVLNKISEYFIVDAHTSPPVEFHGPLHMYVSLPRREPKLTAEIQIRTIFQQAHLEVTHALGYKTEPSMSRRASRIAALAELYDEEVSQLRADLIARNLRRAGSGTVRASPLQTALVVRDRVNSLASEFRSYLDAAGREERLQQFLSGHPEFLYPEYIKSFPKLKLGDQWVTDFVLRVHGADGAEYVFVEIERADKKIFTGSGQFTADFTQAKDQLLNWERWIERNIAYLREKLPDLYKPQFHLVMGRDIGITAEQRDKLKSEFGGTRRRFSTYDDLLTRFEVIIKRLLAGA